MINLPNLISLLRLLLSPLILFLEYYQSLALFIVLSLTDALDGYIARKFKQETNLGLILDPVADKSLLLITLYVFSYKFYIIPPSLLFFLLLRDVSILIGGLHVYLAKGFLPKARLFGKITTAYICTAIPLIALFNTKVLLYFAYFLVFVSFVDYLMAYVKLLNSKVELTSHS